MSEFFPDGTTLPDRRNRQLLIIIGVVLAILLLLWLGLEKTKFGLIVRAGARDRDLRHFSSLSSARHNVTVRCAKKLLMLSRTTWPPAEALLTSQPSDVARLLALVRDQYIPNAVSG